MYEIYFVCVAATEGRIDMNLSSRHQSQRKLVHPEKDSCAAALHAGEEDHHGEWIQWEWQRPTCIYHCTAVC
jgi:hypothetical protein